MSHRLNAVTWGDGTPTVLMLHGFGDGAFVWNHIAPVLAADTSVVAVDFRGHGDSPHDSQARYEPEAHVEDVLELMKSRLDRPVTVVGHSLGAAVAIRVASLAREQVRGLALIDGGPWLNASALRHIYEQFLSQAWLYDRVQSFATELQRRYPLADLQLLQGIAERALRPLPSGEYELKCDRRLVGTETPPDDASLWEELRSFDGPVLVVRGAGSAVLSRQNAARMADQLRDCRLYTASMSGHAVMLDNPAELLFAVEKFLSEIACDVNAREEAVS